MPTRTQSFWIKQRHNPQTGIYYVACGQMAKKDARENEEPLYGYNVMLEFKDETEYKTRLKELRTKGERVY